MKKYTLAVREVFIYFLIFKKRQYRFFLYREKNKEAHQLSLPVSLSQLSYQTGRSHICSMKTNTENLKLSNI